MAAKPKPKPAAKTAAKPAARAATPCLQITRISRQQRSAEIKLDPGPNCKCECKADGRVQNIYRTKYTSAFRLEALLPCDETEPAIFPPGTEMTWKGSLTVRREQCTHDAQPHYFGSNEGTWAINLPGGETVFTGPFNGTVGVHPSKSAEERCCAHGVLLGSITAKGIGKTFSPWTLTASFDFLVFILDRIELCEPNSYAARLNLDGVLIRTCTGEAEKKKAPAKKGR